MVDVVECASQIGVKNPHPLALPHRVWKQGPSRRGSRDPAETRRIGVRIGPPTRVRVRVGPVPGGNLSMITGTPSGRILVLSLAFGMYTRRTARVATSFGWRAPAPPLGPGLAGQRDLPIDPRFAGPCCVA